MEPSDMAIHIAASVSLIQGFGERLRTKEHEGNSDELEQGKRREHVRSGQRMTGQRVGNKRNYGGQRWEGDGERTPAGPKNQ